MKRRLVFVCLVWALVFWAVGPAQAATNPNIGLTITPLRAYPAQDPGFTTTSFIKLTNQTKAPMVVQLSVQLFKTIDENYDYAFYPPGNENWVRFDSSSVSLAAGQSISDGYAVAVPADAKPGGYYFSLVATVKQAPSSTNLTIVRQVSSLVYLQVRGNISRSLHLLGVDTSWLAASPVVNISARVSNSGTSHEEAALVMPIHYWPLGRALYEPALQGLILPDTIRKLNGQIRLGNLPGIYKLQVQFSPPQGGLVKQTHYILYLPVWFIALLAMVILYLARRRGYFKRSS